MIVQDSVLNDIIAIIKEEMAKYNALELILFGSRATGSSVPESDYDLMIIVDNAMQKTEYNDLTFSIYKRLWDTGKIAPLDLIIKNREQYLQESESFGSLAYHVKAEGIIV